MPAVLIICLLFVGAIYMAFLFGRGNLTIPGFASLPSATTAPSQIIPSEEVPIPSPTLPISSPEVSTSAPSNTPPPIDTPFPTDTPFAPPPDGILFQDNFDNGFKPDWNLSDNWITSGGELTQTTQAAFQNYYSWATLNKPEWKNYILSVKINIPYQDSAAQSNVAVAVRVNGQEKYLGVQILPFVGNALYFIGRSNFDSEAVGKFRVFDFASGSTLQIEANGNDFLVSVDGRQAQQVSMSGYESGGIALGIDCLSQAGCPSFDNVVVTYLP